MLDAVNLTAILVACLAAFVFGAAWYGVLAGPWMAAAGLTKEQTKPSAGLFAITFACQVVMAVVLSGVLFHAGGPTPANGLVAGAIVWLGFVATTLIVNHRFQGAPWALTAIDGGHWLGVLLIQGAVIGWFGS